MTAPGACATIAPAEILFLLFFPFKQAHCRHRVRLPLHGVFVCAIIALSKQARSEHGRCGSTVSLYTSKGRSGQTPRSGSLFARICTERAFRTRTGNPTADTVTWPCVAVRDAGGVLERSGPEGQGVQGRAGPCARERQRQARRAATGRGFGSLAPALAISPCWRGRGRWGTAGGDMVAH